ncbi:MAG TPA: 5-oxoprolinase subunit PxpA [Opitutaceae bacterium]|nr:5-oxoprolinase subunit PxpA [Opitutaceae bacterium]
MGRVDLNCDLGEGAGHDTELMPLVTSANIACGGHAGDEASMRAALRLAREHGVAAGAHPSLPDREHFGRREYPVLPDEVFAHVLSQTLALARVASETGARLAHVKPHGALYNMAARNTLLGDAVARAVYEVDPRLVLFALAGSALVRAGRECGLAVAEEVFADRTYQPDGSLTPRHRGDALVPDEAAAVAQVITMVRHGRVRAVDGQEVPVRADTVCIHGDGPAAVALAGRLNRELRAAGVELAAFRA